MAKKIRITREQADAIQTAAMYGEPVGGHTVYLFTDTSWDDYGDDRLSCGCCECCGCDCWMNDLDYEGDYDYDEEDE